MIMAKFLAQNFTTTVHSRMTIKGFKTREAREEWCHKHSSNIIGIPIWKPYIGDAKPGVYAWVGGTWKNVKQLDASLLAHV
jgi:hypothetical protein